MIDVFGTLGPSCEEKEVLSKMFSEGLTGIRINLSHVMLKDCSEKIKLIKQAANEQGKTPKILIDMQGPEIRIGSLKEALKLGEGDTFRLGVEGVPADTVVIETLENGDEVLLDDGKILAEVLNVHSDFAELSVKRGGVLTSRKSLAIVGKEIDVPAITENDRKNIELAGEFGITGVMQPFVRSASDLKLLREALDLSNGQNIKIYAKIENMSGVKHLEEFFPYADEIVIARGDLGNAMPLWQLPGVQKQISRLCSANNKPFMVVTQMLASMEHSKVPTRAEVSDIYNAVLDGAASVMVTGETAVGDNPAEVIRYLYKTAMEALVH